MNDAEARREEVPENEVSQWIQAAQQWLLLDEDPTNQDVLRSLIAQQEAQELSELFGGGRLSFGTAGIRAAVGAGPLRMNTVVVRQTVAGICRWLDEKLGGETPAKIAIGHDARTHSEGFARIAAAECAAHGHEVMTWDEALPTPLVAFATKRRGADVGLVITASHNPATDNGLKVYLGGRLGNGRQLNTPDDGEIALAIEAELQENTQENGQNNAESIFQEESKIRINSGAALQQQYCDDVVQNLAPSGGHVPFVYTAVHGVGHSTFGKLLEQAGFTGMIPVEEQCQPDGTFPTAPRPNPEIAGVLDLAMAAAQDAGVDVIIAHDPDADRCAVAVHQEAAKDGDENTFRRLSGDELGLALAAWLMQTGRLSDGAVASTLVSHSVLPELAAAHGLTWVQTLTGFKWLAAVPHVRFAYEEAIGYCLLPDVVADKDGLSAALGVVELVHWLAQRDQTLPGYLQELADQYGYTASSQMTVPLAAGVNPLAAVSGFQVPDTLADLSVTERKNLATKMGPLPPTPGMVYQAGEQPGQGVRLIVRPSGTEPLLKIYLHVWAPTARQSETLLELLENDVRQLM